MGLFQFPAFALGGTGASQDAALGMGGYTSPGSSNQTTTTQLYDGTAWVTQPNMSTARGYNGLSGGTSTAAFTTGDYPVADTTEEFTGETSVATASTLTTS